MPLLISSVASLLAPYAWDVVENQILPRLPSVIAGLAEGIIVPEPSEEEEEE